MNRNNFQPQETEYLDGKSSPSRPIAKNEARMGQKFRNIDFTLNLNEDKWRQKLPGSSFESLVILFEN